MPILLAIHTAFGGSMKSRVGQRHRGWLTASTRVPSIASTACGGIAPTITAVMWLRSIRASGISALSAPGARTSAW